MGAKTAQDKERVMEMRYCVADVSEERPDAHDVVISNTASSHRDFVCHSFIRPFTLLIATRSL
jgi:hypothetical protein